MRPTRALTAVLAVLSFAPATASAAGITDSPACPAGKTPSLSIVAPAQVAFNRTYGVFLRRASGTPDSQIFGQPATITAADPAQPISTPFSGYIGSYAEYERSPSLVAPLRLAPTDGPALITATWFEQEPQYSKQWCRMGATAIVSGKVGVQPKLKISQQQTSGLGLEFDFAAIPTCADAAGEPITLTVKTTVQTGSLTWADACALAKDDSTSTLSTGVLTKSGVTDGRRFALSEGDHDDAEATVQAYPQGRSVRRIDWTVTSGTTTLASGRFWAQSYPEWHTRIWEEEDNFVNICINGDDYEIRKENGRLYCEMTGEAGVTYFFKKKPKKFKSR
jgi:hypothetical protein